MHTSAHSIRVHLSNCYLSFILYTSRKWLHDFTWGEKLLNTWRYLPPVPPVVASPAPDPTPNPGCALSPINLVCAEKTRPCASLVIFTNLSKGPKVNSRAKKSWLFSGSEKKRDEKLRKNGDSNEPQFHQVHDLFGAQFKRLKGPKEMVVYV